MGVFWIPLQVTTIDIVNCVIASLSLAAAIIAVFFTVRAEVRYSRNVDCKICVQQITDMYAIGHNGQCIPDPFKKKYNYLIHLNLINPASSHMSYFALSVIGKDNRIIPFPVQRWLDTLNYDTICCLTSDPNQNEYPICLMPPPDVYGTLHPHTFLPLTLAIKANADEKIRVCFRVCHPRFAKKHNPSSISEYKIQMYEITLSECANIVKLDIPSEKRTIIQEVARGRKGKKYKKSERYVDKLIRDAESKEDGTNL